MREIKFRVWDYDKIEYFDVCDSWLALKYHFDHCDDHPEWLQQYTGIKDKNGVEIYEGDIVKVLHPDGWLTIEEVYYNTRNASYNFHPEYIYEVVGNMYENPHIIL